MATYYPADGKVAETARTVLHILAGEHLAHKLGTFCDELTAKNTKAIQSAIEDSGYSTVEFFSTIGFLAAGTGKWEYCFLNDVDLQQRVGVWDTNRQRWEIERRQAQEWGYVA